MKFISDDLNPSGHANQNDQQLMLNFMKPQYFIPIQGEYRLLDRHAELAEEVGIAPDRIFLTNKGDVLTYDQGELHVGEHLDVGNTMIDGTGVGDIGNIVLREFLLSLQRLTGKRRKSLPVPKSPRGASSLSKLTIS